MKQKLIRVVLLLAASAGFVGIPFAGYAATDSESTTINASIASVISMTTSGTVSISITPVSGGSQTSSSDTVSVSTNNAAGYALTFANADTTLTLTNGGDTIAAHTGTQASPTALANNSWGYAVATVGGFDASYSTLSNVTSSTTKWAGVPSSASPNTLKSTAATASGDTTTVWYSVKADTTKPNGTYSDTVTYTATTN
jgi:hypothetical protein